MGMVCVSTFVSWSPHNFVALASAAVPMLLFALQAEHAVEASCLSLGKGHTTTFCRLVTQCTIDERLAQLRRTRDVTAANLQDGEGSSTQLLKEAVVGELCAHACSTYSVAER